MNARESILAINDGDSPTPLTDAELYEEGCRLRRLACTGRFAHIDDIMAEGQTWGVARSIARHLFERLKDRQGAIENEQADRDRASYDARVVVAKISDSYIKRWGTGSE